MTHPNIWQQLKSWRDASAVERFHIMRKTTPQTIGAHSHGVAVLCMLVEPSASATLLKAALTHDFHERATGDMPSTAKWLFPELKAAMASASARWNKQNGLDWPLSPHEERVLDFCDYMELMLWSLEELNLGNRYALEPLTNIVRVLDNMGAPGTIAASLYASARSHAATFTNLGDTK